MTRLFIYGTFLAASIQCFDSESFESSHNAIELGSFYDAMIFSDVADIMKEFQTNSLPLLDKDESASDENVEDLLEEYQKFLDKEHKQRKDYVERTKLKNKIPLIRHERFSKSNFGSGGPYNDHLFTNDYFNPFKVYKSRSPLDFLVPLNSKTDFKQSSSLPRDSMELNIFKKNVQRENSPPAAVPPFTKHIFKSPPCCKNENNIINCNQCVATKYYSRSESEPRARAGPHSDEGLGNPAADTKYAKDNVPVPVPDDLLGIHIKVEFHLPKTLDKQQNVIDLEQLKDSSKNLRNPNYLYNLNFPMNMFGLTRVSKINSTPLHKISIHKKKKTKNSTGGKKHRKKLITFHSIKLEPRQIYEAHFGKYNSTQSTSQNDTLSTVVSSTNSPLTTKILEANLMSSSTTPRSNNMVKENILIFVNISNNAANDTEPSHNTNSDIQTEHTGGLVTTTDISNSIHSLKKREVISNVANDVDGSVDETTLDTIHGFNKTERVVPNTTKAYKDFSKKVEKKIPGDEELLFWPNVSVDTSKGVLNTNITAIMLENESKKAKMNMTKDAMHKNHRKTLEKAIFGNVEWNDVGTVVPALVSFVGKYTEGALTACSADTCHSVRCARTVCAHRVCAPVQRFNQRGHCLGATSTENVATMDSIMDLPSNLLLEIVDILQDKMAGTLFGKETLCIHSKCITFSAYKKLFIKQRCTSKELNSKGHCVVSKEGKLA